MIFVLNTCAGREHLARNVIDAVPGIIVNFDDFTETGKFDSTAWFNHQRAWHIIGEGEGFVMEDDIELCDGFAQKAMDALAGHENDVVQFFSMRKKDVEIGSRYEAGSSFIMGQCYYLPKGVGKAVYEHSFGYYERTGHRTCPSDLCVADFLKKNKMRYWVHIPNLVDHLPVKSMLGKRSTSRQSLTFQK